MIPKEKYFDEVIINVAATQMQKRLTEFGFKSFREFDASNCALLVLDMQNYFLDESSHAFIPSSNAIMPNINKLIDIFRNQAKPIIFTQHSNSNTNAMQMANRWKHLTPDSGEMFKLNQKLDYRIQDILIEKHQYDAFYETNLKQILFDLHINSVIICGVVANLCVETSARSAFVNGFNPIVPIDAIASLNFELHFASVLNMSYALNSTPLCSDVINYLEQNEQ